MASRIRHQVAEKVDGCTIYQANYDMKSFDIIEICKNSLIFRANFNSQTQGEMSK